MKTLPEFVAQTLNAQLEAPRERAEFMLKLIKADEEAYQYLADKLILEQCYTMLQRHYRDFNHVIYQKDHAHTMPSQRVQEVKRATQTLDLRAAGRATVERFLNGTLLNGLVRMRDATRVHLIRDAEGREKASKSSMHLARYYRLIATKLRTDDEQVYKRLNERDLQTLFDIAGNEGLSIAAE